MPTAVIRLNPAAPRLEELLPAVRALRAGKLVAFPTETVYGLGTVATDAEAVQRLRQVKGRPAAPFSVHMASPQEVQRYVARVPPRARMLMAKAWPGPLTLLLPADGRAADPKWCPKPVLDRIAPEGVIGLRCVENRVGAELLRRARRPVLACSANLAGSPAPRTGQEVLEQLDGRIDWLVDAGPTRYAKASTIVAFQGQSYHILREGVYDAGAVERMARWTVLFVCTGNTCRSPLAAALAGKTLSRRLGVGVDDLEQAGVQVLSAGLMGGGTSVSRGAAEAAEKLGASIARHQSRKVTAELIRSADLIFCMTRDHLRQVQQMVPDAGERAALLDPAGDIDDPLGGDERSYLAVARRIAASLEKRMREYWP